jgi:hypothetical protein
VFSQYLLAVKVALYERNGFESRPVGGKVDPAYSAEQ